MDAPKQMLYLSENSVSDLLERIDGRLLSEASRSDSLESSKNLSTGAEIGGLFSQLLNLGKLSLGTTRGKKDASATEQKERFGPNAHLAMVLERMKAFKGSRYFESLDEAFELAPEHDSSWVLVRDYFDLTNVGNEWSIEILEKERHFLFKIDNKDNYDYGDDYYKKPLRLWTLDMSASFENWPRLKGRIPGCSSHEALYFKRYNYSKIPLNVFGCFLKAGLKIQIIPYAIWI